MNFRFIQTLLLTFILLPSWQAAKAGFLASGSLDWGVFAFRPQTDEPTPNYHGIGPGLVLGYSFDQTFDVASYFSYIPGSQSRPKPGEENASLLSGGVLLGLRLEDQLLFSIMGGMSEYNLVKPNLDPYQVRGRWAGNSFGASLGSVIQVTKRIYWQISLKLMHVTAARIESEPAREKETRGIDAFVLSASYTFNGFLGRFSEFSIFQ